MKEQIIRHVTKIGNGAHIFAPKEWIGEEIVLVRIPKKPLTERIFEVVTPYLEHIRGIYLYGSYARGEDEKDSDIDLFIITSKKIKIKEKGFEVISICEEDIDRAVKSFPLIMHSIFSESKSVINSDLIGKFKEKYKPRLVDFREFLEDTKRIIDINEEFIKQDKPKVYVYSSEIAYSLVLRLRGIFIIKKLLLGGKYSNKEFGNWIKSKLPEINLKPIYDSYKNIKTDDKRKIKIKVNELEMLLNFLRKETEKLNNQLIKHGK
ncbi:MAG: DUF2080 family transposase-associated protein [Nanoarchaeota archaeon]